MDTRPLIHQATALTNTATKYISHISSLCVTSHTSSKPASPAFPDRAGLGTGPCGKILRPAHSPRLTHRAPARGSLRHDTAFHKCFAHKTSLCFAPIDPVEALEGTRTPRAIPIVPESRSTRSNRSTEDPADRSSKRRPPLTRERRAHRQRVDTRTKQRLVRVDISHTRERPLIEQRRLDHPRRPAQHPFKRLSADRQRVRAQRVPPGCAQAVDIREEPEPPEPPRISEHQPRTVIEKPLDVYVVAPLRRFSLANQHELPAHSQVHAHHPSARAENRELLPVALKPTNPITFQQITRPDLRAVVNMGKVCSVQSSSQNVPAEQRWLKRALQVLNFGQFRHFQASPRPNPRAPATISSFEKM